MLAPPGDKVHKQKNVKLDGSKESNFGQFGEFLPLLDQIGTAACNSIDIL